MNIYPRRLNLKTPNNIRELGGYMRDDQKITKYHEFLRGDLTTNLCKSDIDFLINYGIKTVIDLRSQDEIEKEPNTFSNIKNVNYINLPLFKGLKFKENDDFITLDKFYIEVLKYSSNIGNIFNTFAKYSNDLILFHCRAGKDRTGIITALLLMLSGVSDYDIIADYEVSSTYFKPNVEKMKQLYPNTTQHISLSKGEYIESLLEYIRSKFSNIETFLLEKGATQKNIEIVKNKLI